MATQEQFVPVQPMPTRFFFEPVTLPDGTSMIHLVISLPTGITQLFLNPDEDVIEDFCSNLKQTAAQARSNIVIARP